MQSQHQSYTLDFKIHKTTNLHQNTNQRKY